MKLQTPIIGAFHGTVSTSATRYASVVSATDAGVSATETDMTSVIPKSCAIGDLNVWVETAPGASKSYTFTVIRNGLATDITCTISGSNTTASFTSLGVGFSAGDTISLAIIPAGTPSAPTSVWWSMIAKSSSVITLGSNNNSMNTSAARYIHVSGGSARPTATTETDVAQIIPISGTFKNLYIKLSGSPGSAKSYTFTLMKNGVAQAVTCAVSGSTDTSASDIANSFSVSSGDLVSLKIVPSGTPSALMVSWGVSFDPVTKGDCFMAMATPDVVSTSAVRYQELTGQGGGTWNSTETLRDMRFPALNIYECHVGVVVAPGVGKQWDFNIRKNASNTSLNTTLLGTQTQNSSGTSFTTDLGDKIDVRSTPTGTPAATNGNKVSLRLIMPVLDEGYLNFTGANIGTIASPYLGGVEAATASVVDVVTTNPRTGLYCYRVNPSGSNVGFLTVGGIDPDGKFASSGVFADTLYTEFAFRFTTESSAATGEDVVDIIDASGSSKGSVRLLNSKKLSVYNSAGTLVATGSSVLNTGQWYYIGIKTSTGSGSTSYELRIDGSSELSGTMSCGTSSSYGARFGKSVNRNGTSVDYYFDDIVLGDTAFTDGAYRVLVSYPTSGDFSAGLWSYGTIPTDYTAIDEVPPVGSDYLKVGPGPPNSFTAGMSDINVDSIKSVKPQAILRAESASTAKGGVNLVSGSVTLQASGATFSTTEQMSSCIASTDPNTGSSWTVSGFNAAGVGAVALTASDIRCTWVGTDILAKTLNQNQQLLSIGVGS